VFVNSGCSWQVVAEFVVAKDAREVMLFSTMGLYIYVSAFFLRIGHIFLLSSLTEQVAHAVWFT
jgi:hypothetical protein